MKDQLSALIDGEFDIESADHIITSAKSGGSLSQAWAHYHCIGDAMRGDSVMSRGLSQRIISALNDEPIIFAPNNNIEIPTLTTAHKGLQANKFWSVAASVAAVYFVGVMVMQQQFNNNDTLSPVDIAQSSGMEYLAAHQAAAPSAAAYYIQNASFADAPASTK